MGILPRSTKIDGRETKIAQSVLKIDNEVDLEPQNENDHGKVAVMTMSFADVHCQMNVITRSGSTTACD